MKKIFILLIPFLFVITSTAFADRIWFDFDGPGGDAAVQVDQLRGAARSQYIATQEVDSAGNIFLNATFTESFILNIDDAFTFDLGITKFYDPLATSTPGTREIWADISINGFVASLGPAPGEYSVGFSSGLVDFYRTDSFTAGTDPVSTGTNTLLGSFLVTGGGGDSIRFDNPTATLDFGADLQGLNIPSGYWFTDNSGVIGNDISILPDDFFMALADASINLTDPGTVTGPDAQGRYFRDITFSDNGTTAQFAIVPEPGTMFLLGFGLLGVAAIGRRKRKK